MFDKISTSYDVTNRIMTFGLDSWWRKKVALNLPNRPGLHVLDCATGTGDQIFSLLKNNPSITRIVGIDLAQEMLRIAKKKVVARSLETLVELKNASALDLPFDDGSFDAVTISFGIRNVEDVTKALSEFFRVLKDNGRLIVLEGTVPRNRIARKGHLFYLRHVLPRLGAILSRNKDAYRYLNQTIETFPQGEAFCELLKKAGFSHVDAKPLTLGAVTIYLGNKN